MFDLLLHNLQFIGFLLAMYIFTWGANTVLGIFRSLTAIKETFSWRKLGNGAAKAGIIALATVLLTGVVSLLPSALEAGGITVESTILDGISVAAIATLFITSIVQYAKDAIVKLTSILAGGKNDAEEA